MIRLLVNADDFGFSKGVNHGIIDAHRYGIVNSTSMLVNMTQTEHAVELAKQNKNLRVGIHLTLTCGKAVLPDIASLTTSDGSFYMTKYHQENLSGKLNEVEREWNAQIQRFFEFGLEPTHFDTHHHIHGKAELLPIVRTLSKKYNLPVRNVFERQPNFQLLTDVFFSDFFGENISEEYFDQLEDRVEDGVSLEVMCHPAYIDQALIIGSSYSKKRAEELEILINTKLREHVKLM